MTVTLIINTENLSKRKARCAKEGCSSLSLVDIPYTDARYCERVGTYLAAAGAYQMLFDCPMPKLCFDENGKPYFKDYGVFFKEFEYSKEYGEFSHESFNHSLNDGNKQPHKDGLYISLSHRCGTAAVSFSDSPVGVDIEGAIPNTMLERLTKRLLSRIKGRPEPLSIKYMTGELDEFGELINLCEIPLDQFESLSSIFVRADEQGYPDNPILAFTALEAAAKCTGLGIANFLGTGADISGFFADSIHYGTYTVTTFIKRD